MIANKRANQSGRQTADQTMGQFRDSAGVIISCIDPRSPDLGTHILSNGNKITTTSDQIDI